MKILKISIITFASLTLFSGISYANKLSGVAETVAKTAKKSTPPLRVNEKAHLAKNFPPMVNKINVKTSSNGEVVNNLFTNKELDGLGIKLEFKGEKGNAISKFYSVPVAPGYVRPYYVSLEKKVVGEGDDFSTSIFRAYESKKGVSRELTETFTITKDRGGELFKQTYSRTKVGGTEAPYEVIMSTSLKEPGKLQVHVKGPGSEDYLTSVTMPKNLKGQWLTYSYDPNTKQITAATSHPNTLVFELGNPPKRKAVREALRGISDWMVDTNGSIGRQTIDGGAKIDGLQINTGY